MQFDGETNNLDLVSDTRFLVGYTAADTTYAIEDITRNMNLALDRIQATILRADTRWQFDDQNQTDLPIATANLVANQQDYGINSGHLKIHKIAVKDSSGNWVQLYKIDVHEIATDYAQYKNTAGTPQEYDKFANSIFLFPKPSYSSTGGIKVYFQRGASYFAVNDTTKSPGFATHFHRLVSLHAARDYALVNDMEKRVKNIEKLLLPLEAELIEFYGRRDKDDRPHMSPHRENYGIYDGYPDGSSHPDRFYV